MSSGVPLQELFERGRPATRSLEIDQVIGSLHESFGLGPRPPVTIGRYRVAGRLGAGGLGIVYRAFDPSLARFVAIKVLKASKQEQADHDLRLLREAQVLAQIRHPHVVEVFDVGFFEDNGRRRFFVAMELVEGNDLRLWLAAGRSTNAIGRAFADAASGLMAAHRAGLLHRDFKPSNVLMGTEGAVKVADFGLAAVTQELRAAGGTAWSAPESDAPDGTATLSWRPGGTPHYMSPEQHQAEPLTPATDQFSFCVSLYEALYGGRPFDAADREGLLAAKLRGPSFPRERRIPRPLRQVMQRGLQARPEDRFESMAELEQALRQALSGRRGWIGVAALAAAGTAAAVGGLFIGPPSKSDTPSHSCPSPPPALAVTPKATPALERVLAASPPLAEAWPGLSESLDGYGQELRRRWTASCQLDPPTQAQVQRCLTECGNSMAALSDLLGRGDREALAQGWSLVRSLPDVHTCAHEPGDQAKPLGVVSAATKRARLLMRTGSLAEARRVLENLRSVVDGADQRSEQRHVEIELAEIDTMEGRYAPARTTLEAIYFEAASDGDARTAARAAVRMVAQGQHAGDVKSAQKWSRTAQTQLERMQPPDYELETMVWHNLALAHMVAGDLTAALSNIEQAERRAAAPGVSAHLKHATQQAHAELLLLNGRPAEALRIHTDELHTLTQAPKSDPITTVVDLQSLGNTLMTLHELEPAWRAYRDSFERGASVLGDQHPHTVAACISFAWAEGERGHPDVAHKTLEPCLAKLRTQLGEDHPHVSLANAMEGRLASLGGDHERALRLFEQAVVVLERNFGQSHYAVGDVLHELGRARAAAGDHAGARRDLVRALEVRRGALPEGHINIAETIAELGILEIEHGRAPQGRARLREAIAMFEQRQLPEHFIGEHRRRLEGEVIATDNDTSNSGAPNDGNLDGNTSDDGTPKDHTPDGDTPNDGTPDGDTPNDNTSDGDTPNDGTPDGDTLDNDKDER